MPTDKERNKRFRAERRERLKDRPRIIRETRDEVSRLLTEAEQRIRQILAGAPTDWETFFLPRLQRSVREAMADFEATAQATVASRADDAWQAGVALVDEPVAAGGVRLASALPAVDTGQLTAMRTFLTHKMTDISTTLANRINSELGLVAIGSQPQSQAVSNIATLIDKGGRSRALTIFRTELGRAYSTATQARMSQASERLPGLKKEWRRSGKLHSRPRHNATNGQVRPVDEPFKIAFSGHKLMYPRDPAGPASETINCGCESLPYMESWEQA